MTTLGLGVVMLSGLAVLLIGIAIYNGMVRSRLRAQEAWSAIDVQLKRRTDLVPGLVEVVKGYATHEQGTLTEVVQARNAVQQAHGPSQAAEADSALTGALGRLLVVVEAYPQIRALDNFIALQKDLYDIEDKLAYARQFYNLNVLDFNTRLQVFPQSIIAALSGFKPLEFFEAGEARESVSVRFN